MNPEKIKAPEIKNIPDENSRNDQENFKNYEKEKQIREIETKPGDIVEMQPDPELHVNKIPVEDSKTGEKGESSVQRTEDAEKSDNSKGKKESPVIYTGKELIRNKTIDKKSSKENLVTIIRGAARVKQDKMLMKSEEIQVHGEKSDLAISNYPLVIYDFDSHSVLTAGYGKFDRLQNSAYFRKKPKVVHTDEKNGDVTTIIADEMVHNFTTGVTSGFGHVIVQNIQGTAYATRGFYYEKEDRVELEGNPRIYEKKNIYMADKMYLFRKEKRAKLVGNARVIVIQEKKDSKDKKEVKTLISGDEGEYLYGGTRKITKFETVGKNSFVYVARDDSDTYCQRLIALGDDPDEIELFEKIYVLDKENRSRLFGEYAHYTKQDQMVRVYTEKNSQGNIIRPVAYFYNKQDIVTGKMVAELYERHLDTRMTYARGGVDFHLYEKSDSIFETPRLKNQILGEWAEMEDLKKEVNVLGRPHIKQGKSKIYANKIVIYPDENRLEMLNAIEGSF